jgi:hypothetical protein
MSEAPMRAPKLALVVFVDHGCVWLRGLKRGFRHCFVALRDGDAWLVCDSLKDRIELLVLPVAVEVDLASFYRAQGHRVLIGTTPPKLRRESLVLAPLTCVSVVKRLLGVHAPWVLTPWQLFGHLKLDAYRFIEPELAHAPGQSEMVMTSATANSGLDSRA